MAEGKKGGNHLSEEIFRDEQMKRSINTGLFPDLMASQSTVPEQN